LKTRHLKSTDSQLHAWLSLSLLPGIGAATARKLIASFGDVSLVLGAKEKELREVGGLRQETITAIRSGGASWQAEQEMSRCWHLCIEILPLFDPDYPPLLAQCKDAPLQLFVRGEVAALRQDAVAIVGARAATHYGLETAGRFARELAERGYAVISGMALGIDAAAHSGCMEAGGKTVAVMGCGLDIVYPPQNKRLFDHIIQQGAVVSEYPLGTRPDSFRFPARNRIISGLALGVMVVEAAKRSGSLITAQLALEQNREVFAVPGRIDSFKSIGTHAILQQGAKLVYTVADILEELPPTGPLVEIVDSEGRPENKKEKIALDGEGKIIFDLLDAYPVDIDTIIRQSGLSARQVSETLLLLEMTGRIETLPGNQFRRLRASY